MSFDRARYQAYLEAYNAQDWQRVGREFYTPDIILEGEELLLQGPYVTAFLTDLHRGVRETLHPERVMFDGQHAAVELWAEFTAEVDLPKFLLGPMKQGEMRRASWAAVYDFSGDKISRLGLYRWAPVPQKLGIWPPPQR